MVALAIVSLLQVIMHNEIHRLLYKKKTLDVICKAHKHFNLFLWLQK